jgi:hypothetical protein
MKRKFLKWGKDFGRAIYNAGAVLRRPKWAALALAIFLIFGMILSLLMSGTTEFALLFSSIDAGAKFGILGGAFVRLFTSPLTLIMVLLQSVVLTLLVKVIRQPKSCAPGDSANAGFGALFTLLGSGCPTCGVSLLTPILATIFAGGAYAAVAVLGTVATFAAFVINLWTLKKLGTEVKNV